MPRGGWWRSIFGIMGRLGAKERRFLAVKSSSAFITRDYRRAAEGAFRKPHGAMCRRIILVENFAQAIRAIGEPIHNRTAEDSSMAKLLALLFEVTGLFDMRTRPELLLLQKTMVVVEGVARTLDRRLDMWTTAEPVVREWIARNLGPAGRLESAARVRRRDRPVRGPSYLNFYAGRSRIAAQLDAATRDRHRAVARNSRRARRRRSTPRTCWRTAAAMGVIAAKLALERCCGNDPKSLRSTHGAPGSPR